MVQIQGMNEKTWIQDKKLEQIFYVFDNYSFILMHHKHHIFLLVYDILRWFQS